MTLTALIPALWLSLAAAQPAPMAPIEAPPERSASPFAGKCMWEQISEPVRAGILAKPTLGEAFEALGAEAQAWGEKGVTAAGKACAVADDQFQSAGRRMASWVGRRWGETQLTGRASPDRLDQVYSGFSANEKAVMTQALNARQGVHGPLFQRYFTALAVGPSDANAYAGAMAYLISRLGQDADIVAGR